MRLYEHEDFSTFVSGTVEWLRGQGLARINEQIVEKDYYVTEALRIVSDHYGDKVIFKGGTSLSKGWDLIRRFSEDLDLFLNPRKFEQPFGKKKVRRELEHIKDIVCEHPALTWTENRSDVDNIARGDVFVYNAQHTINPAIPASVLVEAGVRSGDYPTTEIMLDSYVGRYLQSQGLGETAEDLTPFPMTLLHFKRTFIEKLYTINSKVEMMIADGETALGVHARHYYDLAQLIATDETQALLNSSEELSGIVDDYYHVTLKYFKHTPLPGVTEEFRTAYRENPETSLPKNKSLSTSRALFPDLELKSALEAQYLAQCNSLCFTSDFPLFDDVLAGFERIRELI